MNLSDIAILNIKGSDYRCIISLISKPEAINLIQNADLTQKTNIVNHKNLLSRIKMGKKILYLGILKLKKKVNMIPAPLRKVVIDKVLVSNNISFGEKIYEYFIGYLYKLSHYI